MTVFNNSRDFIITVEYHLLSIKKSNYKIIDYFQRLVVLPFKFLMMGVKEKTKGAMLWAFFAFVLIIIGNIIIKKLGVVSTDIANCILLIAQVLPLIFILFPMPSMYGDSGIDSDTLIFTTEHIRKYKIISISQINFMLENILIFENRAKVRIKALKWVVGILWAILVYTLSKYKLLINETNNLFNFSFAGYTSILIFATGISYLLVWGYEESVNKLFRTIEFGCNNFKEALSSPASH